MQPPFTGVCNENYRQRRRDTKCVSLWNAANAAPPLQEYAMRNTANAAAPLGVLVFETPPMPLRHLGCKCLNCRQSRPAFTGLYATRTTANAAMPPLGV